MSTITPISGAIRNDNLTINENFNNLNTDKLESGDLKTINGESIVGSGDLVITATIADGSITETKLSTSVNNSLDLADTSVQPADISDFETTSQLNTRDTNNRARANHTGTQTASTISDFDTEVSNNTDVSANTSARHTHTNKALLDTYTQTEANLADAVAKKHSHANQSVLDATTASFLLADETKLDGIEAGAQVNTVTPTNTVVLTNKDLSSGNTFPTFNQNTTGEAGTVATIAGKISAGTNVTITGGGTTASPYVVNSSGGAGYTDEQAQDAVGSILVDSSEIDFTYDDAVPSITAALKNGSIDETKLDTSVNASLDLADSAVQPGGALGTPSSGTLTNCTFPTLNQDTTGKSAKTDALQSATTTVNVSSATAPTTGQVLTATDDTHATWQTPSSGGGGTILDIDVELLESVSANDLIGLISFEITSSSTSFGYNSGQEKVSGAILGNGVEFNSINVVLKKTGTITDNVLVRIETDNSGKPSGTLADANAIGSLTGSTITTYQTRYNISLSGNITLTRGSKYHVVIYRSGSLSTSNYYWFYYNPTITGIGLECNEYRSSVWNNTNGNGCITGDGLFYSGALKYRNSFSTYQRISGFAGSSGVLGDIIQAKRGIVSGFSSLSPIKNYYPSTSVAGAISLSATSPKIGESLSSTEIIFIQPIYSSYNS